MNACNSTRKNGNAQLSGGCAGSAQPGCSKMLREQNVCRDCVGPGARAPTPRFGTLLGMTGALMGDDAPELLINHLVYSWRSTKSAVCLLELDKHWMRKHTIGSCGCSALRLGTQPHQPYIRQHDEVTSMRSIPSRPRAVCMPEAVGCQGLLMCPSCR